MNLKAKIICLFLAVASLFLLSSCITTILAGSVYNSIGWLFDGIDTEENECDKIAKARTNYVAFCDNTDDIFEEYANEIINSYTEDTVNSNLYSKDYYFGESGKLNFFASLTAYKNKIINETENEVSEQIPFEITSEDIENFIPLFFNYNVSTYSRTYPYKYEITNANGDTEEVESEITITYADINFFTRSNLHGYLNFTDEEKKNAEGIIKLLSSLMEYITEE